MINHLYYSLIFFVAFYPMFISLMWIIFSLIYKFKLEEHHYEKFPPHKPTVTILVAAYNEGKLLNNSLTAISHLNYPHYEVIVINDGSEDDTQEQVHAFLKDPKFRLLNKKTNQGKAIALNDAINLANGEIIVILDADAEPTPDFLHHITWHFQYARVGAVTGHPRVKNTYSFLTRMQVVEFSSIIGLLRRSQRIWGNIVTVSGIATAFRKTALYDVKGFSPDMYTEDMDITWKLQKNHWCVHYEPRAIVWMHVPDRFRDFFKQRVRWARGLLQVLRIHKEIMQHWRLRHMWPIFLESCLSTFWNTAYGLILIIEFMKISSEETLISSVFWIVLLTTISLLQLFLGVILERKHDPDILKFIGYVIFYPLFYWFFMFIVTWDALPVLGRKLNTLVIWSSKRR